MQKTRMVLGMCRDDRIRGKSEGRNNLRPADSQDSFSPLLSLLARVLSLVKNTKVGIFTVGAFWI